MFPFCLGVIGGDDRGSGVASRVFRAREELGQNEVKTGICQRSFNWQSTAFVMRGLRVRLPPLALEVKFESAAVCDSAADFEVYFWRVFVFLFPRVKRGWGGDAR